MKTARKYRILASVSPLWLALDQLVKYLTVERFQLGESLAVVPGVFNLTYVRNPGVAFGFLGNLAPALREPLLIVVPVFALAAIGYLYRLTIDTDVRTAIALSLVVGGALGNLCDRIRLGYVVDSLDFHWQGAFHWPAFNVADIGICVGMGLLMWDAVRRGLAGEKAPQEASL